VSKSPLIIFRVVQVRGTLRWTLHEGMSPSPAMQPTHELLGPCHSSSSAQHSMVLLNRPFTQPTACFTWMQSSARSTSCQLTP
jgi:hypothetical protein